MNEETDDKEAPVQCETTCGCSKPGLGTKGKVLVCLIVGLAAAAVLARGVIKKATAENEASSPSTCVPAEEGSSCCP